MTEAEFKSRTSARRPTIRDVAATAGVSKSLVSLVFSDPDRVSPARRQLVLDVADQLQFRPNWAARSLAAEHGQFIGILVADLHYPAVADIVAAAREQFDKAGVFPLLTSAAIPGTGQPPELDRRIVDALGDLRARSLLVVGEMPDMSALERIAADIPLVVASAVPGRLPIACTVRTDDDQGMALAVGLLAQLGHTRITHVGGLGGMLAAGRASSYRAAMSERGLQEFVAVEESDGSQQSGYEATLRLLTSGRPPTAICAGTDLAAIGAMSAAADLGLRVPEDLSVIGYDNTPFAALRQIALTSIDPGNSAIGSKAATWLLREIAGQPRRPELYLVDPTLVVRSSTGPVHS